MFAICPNEMVNEEEKEEIMEIFESFGKAEIINEKANGRCNFLLVVHHQLMYICLLKLWQMQ